MANDNILNRFKKIRFTLSCDDQFTILDWTDYILTLNKIMFIVAAILHNIYDVETI